MSQNLKVSISGIRGIVGLKGGLNPPEIINYTCAYCQWVLNKKPQAKSNSILIGRDGRQSGKTILNLVQNTIIYFGLNVINIDLTTTPTISYSILKNKLKGGIMITASHNPSEWNALKFFDNYGEFIDENTLTTINNFIINQAFTFAQAVNFGKITKNTNYLTQHINDIAKLPFVLPSKIKLKNFNIVVDVINSSGNLAIPILFKKLGVKNFTLLHSAEKSKFDHNPEPLPENLKILKQQVIKGKYDLGIAVDPDVDRVCFIQENGECFGEEYSLVAIADYYLQFNKSPLVNNLSSTMALKSIADKHNTKLFNSKVGEAWVVKKMKQVKSKIGGEGNGGIIIGDLHYGRDALIGIALFLSYLALSNQTCSSLKKTLPQFIMKKAKFKLNNKVNLNKISQNIKNQAYDSKENVDINTEDGLKLSWESSWIHIRPSNTEPVIRIIAEAKNKTIVNQLIKKFNKNYNL